MKEEPNFEELLQLAKRCIEDIEKSTNYTWTKKHASVFINVAIKYLKEAKQKL